MVALWMFPVLGVAAVVVLILWSVLRRPARGESALQAAATGLPESECATARSYLRGQWRGYAVALLAGLGACAGMWHLGGAYPQWYGMPYALAGAVGALVGLLVLNLVPHNPWPSDGHRVRVGELAPRGSMSFARQWVFLLPMAAAVLLVASLVLTGLYSATDESGIHRVYTRRSLSGWAVENGEVVDLQYNLSTSSPFPGWYYGVPLIAATVVFATAVYFSLRRTALAPRPGAPALFALDTALRTLRTRFIMAASSAALGFQISGTGIITGFLLLRTHTELVPTADFTVAPDSAPVEPGHTLAIVLIVVSLVIAVAALVLLLRAVGAVAQVRAAEALTGLPAAEPAAA